MQTALIKTALTGIAPNRFLRVTPSRIAVCGRFGRPTVRTMGAWLFYLSLGRPFELRIQGKAPMRRMLALVEPWTAHRVATEDADLAMVMVEPESVDGASMFGALMSTPKLTAATAARLWQGFQHDSSQWTDFDRQFFGLPLPSRRLDTRLNRAIDYLARRNETSLSVHECAGQACLSASRLMHLFDEQLGTTFRRFRGWKRARGLLCHMGGAPRMSEIALEAGYTDSTQLSRSIRACYGYTPTAMFQGSRRFSVIATP